MCFSTEQKGLVSGDLCNPSQRKLPGCLALRHTNCFGKGAALDFLTGQCRPNVLGTRRRGQKGKQRAEGSRQKEGKKKKKNTTDLSTDNKAVVLKQDPQV